MTLLDSLNWILDWHQKHETPTARLIQPGLEEDQIVALLKGLPFQLSREFIELYKWRNGVPLDEDQGDTSFFDFHRFLPLDEALSVFEITYPITKEFYELTDWVQVFQDPAGDGYGLSGGPQAAERAPVVFLFEGEGVKMVFDDLAGMLETVVAAFQQGAMGWEDERMETDYFAWGQVAHRLNPGIKYWRDYVKGGG